MGDGADKCKVDARLCVAAGAISAGGSAALLTDRVVVLLRVRRVSILLMAGRGEGYGAGLGVAEGRELDRGDMVRAAVFGGVTGSSGASTEFTASICSPGSG